MLKKLFKAFHFSKSLRTLQYVLLATCIFASFLPTTVLADTELEAETEYTEDNYAKSTPRYTNEETGYELYIADWAQLISSSDKEALLEDMKPITEHGNVAFISIEDNNTYSTEKYAKNFCTEYFGYESGTVFIIDMDYRYIWIYSQGSIYNTITDDYADTITDNVYSYASSQDYYTCASKAFNQINSILEGKWIAQPMKFICNALLSIAIALLINYFLVMALSRSRKPTTNQLLNGIYSKVNINNARADFTHQTKRYSPQSSSSGGGGGSHGGGGGGGSHGGGGGHRF